jgi:hypothetical protein
MTSSGTYNFNPAASDLVLTAFSRCGKSGAVLTAEHLSMASIEANLLNVEWGNRGVNLWESALIQVPPSATLTQGTNSYVLPATTISVIIAYIETGSGQATNDRVMGPLSTYEYNAISNKLVQGPPSAYWYDRQITPLLRLYPTPDNGGPYTMFARVLQQIQDVVLPAGVTLNAPYRFFDAFVAGLSARLAVHYAPERFGIAMTPDGKPGTGLAGAAETAWRHATNRDTENVAFNIVPQTNRYFRL